MCFHERSFKMIFYTRPGPEMYDTPNSQCRFYDLSANLSADRTTPNWISVESSPSGWDRDRILEGYIEDEHECSFYPNIIVNGTKFYPMPNVIFNRAPCWTSHADCPYINPFEPVPKNSPEVTKYIEGFSSHSNSYIYIYTKAMESQSNSVNVKIRRKSPEPGQLYVFDDPLIGDIFYTVSFSQKYHIDNAVTGDILPSERLSKINPDIQLNVEFEQSVWIEHEDERGVLYPIANNPHAAECPKLYAGYPTWYVKDNDDVTPDLYYDTAFLLEHRKIDEETEEFNFFSNRKNRFLSKEIIESYNYILRFDDVLYGAKAKGTLTQDSEWKFTKLPQKHQTLPKETIDGYPTEKILLFYGYIAYHRYLKFERAKFNKISEDDPRYKYVIDSVMRIKSRD